MNTFAKTSKGDNGKKFNYKTKNTEVAFAQTWDLSKITCNNCGKKGYYANTYPKKETNWGSFHTQVTKDTYEGEEESEESEIWYVYHQNLAGLIWKTCLLIDSEISINVFNNLEYLTGIHKVKKTLKFHCNTGCVNVNQKGWFGQIEVSPKMDC